MKRSLSQLPRGILSTNVDCGSQGPHWMTWAHTPSMHVPMDPHTNAHATFQNNYTR